MRSAVVVWVIAMCVAIGHPAAQEADGGSTGAAQEADAAAGSGGSRKVLLPNVIKLVEPVYPQAAASQGVSGTVVVGVAIDAEGRIQEAGIAQSVPMLDEAALAAVKQWQFEPPVVDGTPVPTGVNVTFDFALGASGNGPVPPIPEPRPSWIPEDFAFHYVYFCREGERVSIDRQQYAVHPANASTPSVQAAIQLTIADIQPMYLELFAAGAFSEPGPSWRQGPNLRQRADGFVVTVLGKLPPSPTISAGNDGPDARPHYLDVRHYGTWRRIEWHEPDYDGRPESHDQLETIGQLIRDMVARKPAVMELPPAQRACLQD